MVTYPREILNRLKWDDGKDLDDAIVWYVHRGAPGDLASVPGSDIKVLGRGFFETGEASIPYHRITRIEYRGSVIFDKERERAN